MEPSVHTPDLAKELATSVSRNEHYKASLRLAKLGSWEWDILTNTSYWSDECHRIFAIQRGELETSYATFLDRVHPEDREQVEAAIGATYSGQGPYEIIHRVLTMDGQLKYTRSQGEVERNEAGEIVKMIGTLQDITELKLAEQNLQKSLQEKEVLLQEVHHRVKNNIEQIRSLLRLQIRTTDNSEIQSMLTTSENRVQAISFIHEILSASPDITQVELGVYLRKLSINYIQAFTHRFSTLDIQIDSDPIELNMELALQVGLIINELLMNSMQHAFPEAHQQKAAIHIAIQWEDPQTIAIQYTDNGIGLPEELDFSLTNNLGLGLIQLLVEQMQGSIETLKGEGAGFALKLHPLM